MTRWAFDADVLICAGKLGHPFEPTVWAILDSGDGSDRVGSVLLLSEVLSKAVRGGYPTEIVALTAVLGRLRLQPVDRAVADVATALAATYRLRAADAVHLATAVSTGADHFLTNNRKDFGRREVLEMDVVFPDDLTPPAGAPGSGRPAPRPSAPSAAGPSSPSSAPATG